jgi:hypothetical protein
MIVSNTVVTKLGSVLVVLELAEPTPGISPGTGGELVSPVDVEPLVGMLPTTDEPTPGISPARAVPERTHASVSAMSNRFIIVSFELGGHVRVLT